MHCQQSAVDGIKVTVTPLADVQVLPARATAAVVLGGTVVLAATLHATLALRSPSPWILPDELIYSELAKSISDTGLPRIRGEMSFSYGIVYPMLLAPIWGLFSDVTTAYAVAKVLNALILSLSAVPAYFLARRFVAQGASLVVAALSVAVPSMLYAGTLMTEVALYPAFLLALLAITVAIERPAVSTQAAAIGAIGLASAIKMLAIVLVVAYVAAVLLFHWLDTASIDYWRARLRSYIPTWIMLGVAIIACSALFLRGANPIGALGAYAVVLGNINLHAVPWWTLLHLAELDLYLAVIPVGATILVALTGLRRHADRDLRLFAALFLPSTLVVILAVSAFSSRPQPGGEVYWAIDARIHERATFILAPIFFIGLMLWLGGLSRGSRNTSLVVFCIAAILPATIPSSQFSSSSSFQALALAPWARFEDVWPVVGLAIGCTLAALAGLARSSRLRSTVICSTIAMVLGSVSLVALSSMELSSSWARERGWGSTAAWVDRAVGDAAVSVLWSETGNDDFVRPAPRHWVLWLGEFFNRRVGTVYELGTPMPYNLPATPVRLDHGNVVRLDGAPARLGELVLTPCHVRVSGEMVTRDPRTGATVVRVGTTVQVRILEGDSLTRTCPAMSR